LATWNVHVAFLFFSSALKLISILQLSINLQVFNSCPMRAIMSSLMTTKNRLRRTIWEETNFVQIREREETEKLATRLFLFFFFFIPGSGQNQIKRMFSASSGIVTPRFSHDNSTIESCNLIIGETFGLGQDGDIVPSFFLSFMFQAFSLECQAILDRYSISRLGSIPHFPLRFQSSFLPSKYRDICYEMPRRKVSIRFL
jgi:hypothetical protein